MNSIFVCFSLKSASSSLSNNDSLEKNFQTVYKPIIKFLYSHPDFAFSFAFNGKQIEFFKKRKNEFITILRQLVERKQIEILGGGYYDPILPLLTSVDRNGQIDMLSAEIRQTIGKRPRGISLYADCWDSSLVNCLQTCGIEYVLLDSANIPENKQKYLPLIMSDLGKSVDILPCYDIFKSSTEMTAKEFVVSLTKIIDRMEKKDKYFQLKTQRIVNINLTHEQLIALCENRFFENLNKYIQKNANCRIKTTIPTNYNKENDIKVPCYINQGLNSNYSKYILKPYTQTALKETRNFTIYDFMETYPQTKALYNRIMYLSLLINQSKLDKMRKKAAREKLWEAQNGQGLISLSENGLANSKNRQISYKLTMEAEKILREDGNFSESLSCFDYNNDGLNEYVCRMQNYFSYISLISGAIQELDILKNTGNYADNLSRILEFDGCTDNYERGLFIDHIFSEEQYLNYINGEPGGDGIFSRIKYSELKLSQLHHEVTLCANAVYGPKKQKIFLRKKYILNSDGMNVQYILRNDSEKKLQVKFAVESNFAHTDFSIENPTYYNLEVVDNEGVLEIDTKKSSKSLILKNKLKNVEAIRLTDIQSGISFGLEPNEDSLFFYMPLIFKRPVLNSSVELLPSHMTFVNTLFWDVNLEPGMETEKTINFTITNVKKNKKSN